jgi:hypothetical protein
MWGCGESPESIRISSALPSATDRHSKRPEALPVIPTECTVGVFPNRTRFSVCGVYPHDESCTSAFHEHGNLQVRQPSSLIGRRKPSVFRELGCYPDPLGCQLRPNFKQTHAPKRGSLCHSESRSSLMERRVPLATTSMSSKVALSLLPFSCVISTLWSRLFFFSEAGIRQPSFLTDWSCTGFGRAGVGQQGELP